MPSQEKRKKKTETKPEEDKFWTLKEKLVVIFPDEPGIKNQILADHGFGRMVKWDVKDGLRVESNLNEFKLAWKLAGL